MSSRRLQQNGIHASVNAIVVSNANCKYFACVALSNDVITELSDDTIIKVHMNILKDSLKDKNTLKVKNMKEKSSENVVPF